MEWVRKLEPSRVYAVIGAVFALLAALGVSFFTDDIKAAVFGLVSALITLVAGEATRSQVTPNAKVLAYVEGVEGHYPEIVAGEATVTPTTKHSDEILEAAYEGRHRAAGD